MVVVVELAFRPGTFQATYFCQVRNIAPTAERA